MKIEDGKMKKISKYIISFLPIITIISIVGLIIFLMHNTGSITIETLLSSLFSTLISLVAIFLIIIICISATNLYQIMAEEITSKIKHDLKELSDSIKISDSINELKEVKK